MAKIKVLGVGCGGISKSRYASIRDHAEAELVGLVDVRLEAAKERAEFLEMPTLPCYTDLEEALAATSPDLVFDCTIPAAHCEVTVTALRHGCHVLGEKPMATSLDEARRMLAAAEESGKLYAVSQNRRYDTPLRAIRKALDEGIIGEVHTVNADFYLGAQFGGFRDSMPHVLLVDMAIHSFDQARALTGLDPRHAYCHEFNPPGSWFERDACAHVIFGMNDGAVFTYRGSWCAEGYNTTWECFWHIVGSRGSVRWDGADFIEVRRATSREGFRHPQEDVPFALPDRDPSVDGHNGAINDMIRAIQAGDAPETIATDNIKSLAMVFAAVESAETGRRVDVTV